MSEVKIGGKTIGRVVSLDINPTPASCVVVAGFEKGRGFFEVSGTVEVTFVDESILEAVEEYRAEIDRIARKIIKRAITVLPELHAEQRRQQHPRHQSNPKGYRRR